MSMEKLSVIHAGVSIKTSYRRSSAACRTLTTVCLDFINENKNDMKFLNATKKSCLVVNKNTNQRLAFFFAQNAGNRIS